MAKIYKIHPAIGIMRIGNAPDFFVGPESLGSRGTELGAGGAETPITNFKTNGLIKKQGARFRVWEYDVSNSGVATPVGEVQAPTTIEWTVTLANSKGAGNKIQPIADGARRVLVPTGAPRNAGITNRQSLSIQGGTHSLQGGNSGPVRFNAGTFLGVNVDLGAARTDGAGRLIICGGSGKSEGVPLNAGGPIPKLSSFDNNDRWYDDVSDGPVTARVMVPGQPVAIAMPSWVICAPPDFAPGVGAPVSLYETAIQAAITRGWMSTPATPSFARDILPVLSRAYSLRWVDDWVHWDAIGGNWAALSDPTNHSGRLTAFTQITTTALNEYGLPKYLLDVLTKWRDGNFVNDFGTATTMSIPEELDRAALEACVATSFFPGIEAGFTITNPQWYMEPFRLSHQQVVAGQLTSQMAVPWQADFNDCDDDWWPSQRPNNIYARVGDVPNTPVSWADGVYVAGTPASRQSMVKDFAKLGYLEADAAGNQLEAERDPTLPPR